MKKIYDSTPQPLALDNFKGNLFTLDDDLIRKGCEASARSRRKRIMFPVQRSQDDAVQRLINFLQPGTYIRPHLHPLDGASETIILLRGKICFQIFDEQGEVTERITLKAGEPSCMADIVPGVKHNFVVLSPDTVVAEFKNGPYDASTDKQFLDSSPEEGTEEAAKLLVKWQNEIESY